MIAKEVCYFTMSLKNSNYKIVLFSENKYIKTLYYCNRLESVIKKYNTLLLYNNVKFSKNYINDGDTLKKSDYKIKIIKNFKNKDNIIFYKEEGIIFDISETLLDKWVVIRQDKYLIEETFKVNNHNKRLCYEEIINNIFLNNDFSVRSVNILYNKLVIYNDKRIDVIICKNNSDCKKLFIDIYKSIQHNKDYKFMFLGEPKNKFKKFLYNEINKKLGWSFKKIYRKTSNYK
jgi:hypothetical protein